MILFYLKFSRAVLRTYFICLFLLFSTRMMYVNKISLYRIDVIEVQFLMIFGFILSAVFGEDVWLYRVSIIEGTTPQ